MVPVPEPPEPALEPDRSSGACADARELLRRFLGTGLDRDADRRFRSHLVSCTTCRGEYRRAITSAAGLHRAARRAEEDEERRERLVRRRDAIDKSSRVRSASWRLRLAILPALLILVVSPWGPFHRTSKLVATWGGGTVQAAGTSLSEEIREAELREGDWCTTRGAARVWLEGGGGRLALGGDTQILVLAPAVPRLRLQRGVLEVEGSAAIVCQLGLVQVRDGRASIDARGGLLVVACEEGTVLVQNAGGSRELAAGERVSADLERFLDGRP